MAGLSSEDLTEIATRALGPSARCRDLGLLSAALARVDAQAAGRPLYRSVEEQAAALLHSLATTAPLEAGNRPFARVATAVYLARRGRPSALGDREAVALVTDVMTGRLDSVADIAERLAGGPGPAADDRGRERDHGHVRCRHDGHPRGAQPGPPAGRARSDRR